MKSKTITLKCVANSHVDGNLVKKGEVNEYELERGKELLASTRFTEVEQEVETEELDYISAEEFDGEWKPNTKACKDWKAEQEAAGYTVISAEEFAKLEAEQEG